MGIPTKKIMTGDEYMSEHTSALSRKVNRQFSAVSASFWIAYLPVSGFVVVLLQSKSFSDTEIGFILAFQSIASIISPPLLSVFAEKHPRIPLKTIVLTLLLIGAGAYSIVYFLPHLFVPAVIIFVFMGITVMSAPSLLNAIAMQLNNRGVAINYGVSRGIGSLSFACAGIVLGKLVELSSVNIVVPAFVLFALFTCALLLRLLSPEAVISQLQKEEDHASLPAQESVMVRKDPLPGEIPQSSIFVFLAKNKVYTGFCFASIFLFASHSAINNYLPNITDALGGTIADQGIVRSIAAACELPIMFLYSFLAARICSHKLLVFSAFSFFLKAVATLFSPSMAILFAVQVFQMPAFGLYTPSAVHFADNTVDDSDRIRAQAIAMVVGIGIGNVVGNLGGGILLDTLGLQKMLLISTLFACLGFILMAVFLREKPSRSMHRIMRRS